MLEHFDTVMSFAVVMLLLSLVVTTLVQMAVAVAGLRGSILKWGIERLLIQVAPELGESVPKAADKRSAGEKQTTPPSPQPGSDENSVPKAKKTTHASQIAEAVLRHAMISHVRIRGVGDRRATSIRKEELIQLLDDLANSDKSPLAPETKQTLKQVMGVAQTPEFAAAAERMKAGLEGAFPKDVARVRHEVEEALAKTRKVVSDVGAWFDTVMDRTTENFLLKTRWITAGMALVLAFWLHVDSLQIIRQLASQPALRAKLVESAEATLRKAEGTFALTAQEKALGSATLAMVKAGLTNSPDAQLIGEYPANLMTREAGESWLNAKLADSTNREAIVATYRTKFEENTKVWLEDLRRSALDLNTSLKQTDLTIIPSPRPPLCDYVTKPGHFLGTVMTVFFLSLGAPFWYNVLRQLANLRPAVAQKIEPKSLSGR